MHPSIGAAVEVFVALFVLLYGAGFVKNVAYSAALSSGLPASSTWVAHASGLGHCAGLLVTFLLLYSRRLRPGPPQRTLLQSAASVLRSLWRAVLGPGGGSPRLLLSAPGTLLLAFHLGSLLYLCWGVLASPQPLDAAAWGSLWRCASPTALLWAPAFEELLFRGALFYLALQRSGGNVPLAAALGAGAFAAMHAPNILAAGADWGYVSLQVLAAAVCGGAWTCVFAAQGCLAEVALLHVANNLAAVLWLAGTRSAQPCSLAPPPPEQRTAALLSLLAQTAVYTGGGVMAWKALQRATAAEGGGLAFRRMHQVVYCDEAEAAAAGVAKTE
jgi:membrane protease YdiL (CAAX protease family)